MTARVITTIYEYVWVTHIVTQSVSAHRSLTSKRCKPVTHQRGGHMGSFPFGQKDGTLLITTPLIAIEEGVTVMTTSYYADRANVYRLFHLHPDWTQPQL